MKADLCNDLLNFGASESGIKWLGTGEAHNYLNLTPSFTSASAVEGDALPEVVVEIDGLPIAYIVRFAALSQKNHKEAIQRLILKLSCRSDARYLCAWKKGEVEIYQLTLGLGIQTPIVIAVENGCFLFQEMSNGAFNPSNGQKEGAVETLILNAVKRVFDLIIENNSQAIQSDQLIGLLKKILLMRFMLDRNIISNSVFPELYELADDPRACFKDLASSELTCNWLSQKFNKNISANNHQFDQFSNANFEHLNELIDYKPANSSELSIADIDFSYISADLLSRVCEKMKVLLLLSDGDGVNSSKQRFVADLMVDQAFNSVEKGRTVLIASVDSGALVLATLRRLIRENLALSISEIKDIIKNRIMLMDVSNSVRESSCYGVLLTLIEFGMSNPTSDKIFLGNSLQKPLVAELSEHSKEDHKYGLILGQHRKAPDNSSKPIDEYIQQLKEWVTPKGCFCLLTDEQIEFKNNGQDKVIRNNLFSSTNVTGLICGINMEERTGNNVCSILFAFNELPDSADCMRVIHVEHDAFLERQEEMRVDYAKAQLIQHSYLRANPRLLLNLSLCNSLDVHVIRTMDSTLLSDEIKDKNRSILLKDYWQIPWMDIKPKVTAQDKRRKRKEDRLLKKIQGMTADKGGLDDVLQNTSMFKTENLELIYIANDFTQYHRGSRAHLGAGPDGMPCIRLNSSWHNEPELLAKYFYLLATSDLLLFYSLLNAPGIRRADKLNPEDINYFPIIPLETLSVKDVESVKKLYQEVAETTPYSRLDELNAWAFSLYGLDEADQQAVSDNLFRNLSLDGEYLENPSKNEINTFVLRLESELEKFFSLVDDTVLCSLQGDEQGLFLRVIIRQNTAKAGDIGASKKALLSHLNENKYATKFIYAEEIGVIDLWLLTQKRYWTESEARLIALEIIRHHRDQFPLSEVIA